MTDTRIKSNQNVGVWIGPISAIADITKPTLAELNTLTNVSQAIKWDGYDFKRDASEQDEDRALTDAANASSRGLDAFGGAIPFYTPQPTDTSSVYRDARNLVSTPHTELAVITRVGISAAEPWDEGQVFNSYHVITDANRHQRGEKNRYYSVSMKSKGFTGVNRIVPAAVPNAVVKTPSSTLAIDVDETSQVRAAYEGVNVTVGATWHSSDEDVAIVTKHGIVIGISAGTANITATYPGSAAGTSLAVTVS